MTDPASRTSLRARALSGSIWTLIGTGFHAPIAIATTVVLARVLDLSAYGRLALLTFAIGLTQALATLGLMTSFLRQVSFAHGRGDAEAERTSLRMSLTTAAAQMSVVVLLAAVLLHGWLPVALIAAYGVAVTITTPPAIYLTATNRGAIIAQTAMVSTVATAVTTVTVAATTHRPDLVITASLLASYLPHLALIPLAARAGSAPLGWGRIRVSRAEWRFSLMSLANAQITTLVFAQSETAFFRPSQAVPRGRFAATSTVGARATLLIDSVFGSVSPALVTLQGRDPAEMRRGVDALFRVSTALFTLLFPAAIVAATLATPYVFPASFGDLRWWVLPLIAISLLQTAAQPALSTWTALGTAGAPLTAGAVGAVIDLGLSAVLVPTWGLAGAVVASVAGGAIYLVLLAVLFRGRVGGTVYRTYLASIGAAAAIGGALDALTIASFGPHSVAALVAVPLAGLASLIVLLLARPLTESDLLLLQPEGVRGPRRVLSSATVLLLRPAVGRR